VSHNKNPAKVMLEMLKMDWSSVVQCPRILKMAATPNFQLEKRLGSRLNKKASPPALMDDKKSKNHKLVKSYLEEVVFPSPALTISEAVFIEVMVNNVAVTLQQNNSHKEQNYAKHHASLHTFRL
jgi:hypothetical protein